MVVYDEIHGGLIRGFQIEEKKYRRTNMAGDFSNRPAKFNTHRPNPYFSIVGIFTFNNRDTHYTNHKGRRRAKLPYFSFFAHFARGFSNLQKGRILRGFIFFFTYKECFSLHIRSFLLYTLYDFFVPSFLFVYPKPFALFPPSGTPLWFPTR